MTKAERMKALWASPEFRERMKHKQHRRAYGELKREREERRRRREAKRATREAKRVARETKRALREQFGQELAEMRKKQFCTEVKFEANGWPRCWRCAHCNVINAPVDNHCFLCGEAREKGLEGETTYE